MEQQLFVYKADFYTIPRDPAIIVAINILINPDKNFKHILRTANAVSDLSEGLDYARSAVTFVFCSVRTDDIFEKCSLLHCKDHFDLLTPWSRVILEKLTGSQLVKKFPAFYGTRRFITVYTEPDQSSPCLHPTS
jgi:hypothetical protein